MGFVFLLSAKSLISFVLTIMKIMIIIIIAQSESLLNSDVAEDDFQFSIFRLPANAL